MPRPKRTDEANCVYLQIKDSCHLCYAPDTASVHGEIATSGRRYHPFETVLASAIPNPESDPWRSLATGLTLSMTGQLALIYPNVWANYGNANALINAYYVDWDLLSFLQDLAVGIMSDALGRRIKRDGPFDQEVTTAAISLIVAVAVPGLNSSAPLYAIQGIWPLVKSHYRGSYLYGLLVSENAFGTIVLDILGFSSQDLDNGRSP